MSVASIRTASGSPIPYALTSEMPETVNARKTTEIATAAAVTMRPVRSSPRATAAVGEPVSSYSSRVRDSRKTW